MLLGAELETWRQSKAHTGPAAMVAEVGKGDVLREGGSCEGPARRVNVRQPHYPGAVACPVGWGVPTAGLPPIHTRVPMAAGHWGSVLDLIDCIRSYASCAHPALDRACDSVQCYCDNSCACCWPGSRCWSGVLCAVQGAEDTDPKSVCTCRPSPPWAITALTNSPQQLSRTWSW